MLSFTLSAVALLSALLPTALAQTHTACNPLNTTGCPDMPALGGNVTFQFNKTMNGDLWIQKNQGAVDWSEKGTTFTVAREGDSPTIQSSFYLFFGKVSIIMEAAPGQGIVSSAILESDDLDEVDWEFLGGNTTAVMTNYFGKGNTTDYNRGKNYNSAAPQEGFHNYTIDWNQNRTQWWVDGKMYRELAYADALGGKNYPQTPMTLRMGAWAGGDVKNNNKDTVAWAGGPTDFSKGPFAMTVQQVYAEDYTTGAKMYSWQGDNEDSGNWQNIKVTMNEKNSNGQYQQSPSLTQANKPVGVKAHVLALSKTAKIAIAASVLGVVVILLCLMTFCCIKQRRAGRAEHTAFLAQQDRERAETMEYKQKMTANLGFNNNSGYNRI